MSIEEKITNIDKKVDLILELLNTDLKKNCEKMGEHIDFVETVYDKVRNPLSFVCNRVNEYCGKNEEVLQLEDKETTTKDNILIENLEDENSKIPRHNLYLIGSSIFIGCLLYKYFR